jgi:hypothetical protein
VEDTVRFEPEYPMYDPAFNPMDKVGALVVEIEMPELAFNPIAPVRPPTDETPDDVEVTYLLPPAS